MKALQHRFRNLRRKPLSSAAGITFAPPAKRRKVQSKCFDGQENVAHQLLDEATFLRHTDQIKQQWLRGTRNRSALASLMQETSANRRKWIVEERPVIASVTEKFPPLKQLDMVCLLMCMYIINYCRDHKYSIITLYVL